MQLCMIQMALELKYIQSHIKSRFAGIVLKKRPVVINPGPLLLCSINQCLESVPQTFTRLEFWSFRSFNLKWCTSLWVAAGTCSSCGY